MTSCRWEESFDGLHYLLGTTVRRALSDALHRRGMGADTAHTALEWTCDGKRDADATE